MMTSRLQEVIALGLPFFTVMRHIAAIFAVVFYLDWTTSGVGSVAILATVDSSVHLHGQT